MAAKAAELQNVEFNWSGVKEHPVSVRGTFELSARGVANGTKITIFIQLAESDRADAVRRLDEALHVTLRDLAEATKPPEG